MKVTLTPPFHLLWRVKVDGRVNVPTSGPVILAPNHRSFMDSMFLPLVVRRRVTFVAKAEYFDNWKTRWFFRGAGQIPIRREGGSASERALETAQEVLAAGGVFAIYPEGTRTRDGKLHRGHTGVARLALETGAPIIPVGLIGTDEVQGTDRIRPRLFRTVTVSFGAPLDLRRHAQVERDRLVLRDIADELMYEIQVLTGYTYEDTYATKQPDGGVAETVRVTTFDDRPVSAAS
jgi:1-acyl-sn-glycerol-3-phosphate acyltransferase